MIDTIHVSSSNEEEESVEKPTKGNLTRETSNLPEGPKLKSVTEETLSVTKKGTSGKGMMRYKGRRIRESRDYDGMEGDSWSTFREFLRYCHETEVTKRNGDSKLMTTILDKLTQRFKDADPEYSQSEQFRESVTSIQNQVGSDPSNLFVYMKQVGDELKHRCVKSRHNNHKRKLDGEECLTSEKRSKNSANGASEAEEEDCGPEVNASHCRKLEKIFEKVYRKVKKLEEKEVDWDAEENSEYIRLERYKKRLYTIWEKWQEVRGRMDEVKKLKFRKIAFSGTAYPELDHAIEKYVNKTKCFPDFMDIYKVTSDTLNKEMEMALESEKLKSIASAAFLRLGNQLQKVRLYDFWNCCMSYLPSTSNSTTGTSSTSTNIYDPAEQDKDLAEALEENKKHEKHISDVLDSFVAKQVDEKHEPEEVIIGTDEEGSAPSGDDEEEEEEDENPEDIICISSSSSEESADETEIKQEKSNGDKHSSNGCLTKVENKVKSNIKSEREQTADYISFSATSKEKSLVYSGKVKVEAGEGSLKMKSVASCSLDQKKAVAFSHNKGNKQTKAGDSMEIVILSESDSGE
ncbi:daxx-like protein [Hetaerina americana]|uniref:daxx-like protein n=1 Tax=Hetaerina americana TaxID=62018 RepID=UPI003A7F47E9